MNITFNLLLYAEALVIIPMEFLTLLRTVNRLSTCPTNHSVFWLELLFALIATHSKFLRVGSQLIFRSKTMIVPQKIKAGCLRAMSSADIASSRHQASFPLQLFILSEQNPLFFK